VYACFTPMCGCGLLLDVWFDDVLYLIVSG